MIQHVVRVPLPVGEDLVIQKNRIGSGGKRLCIVTGTHGDELEGQYVAWRLAELLRANPQKLHGTVDIYPAANPLGISTMTRGIPMCDLDMNRTFPGSTGGSMSEYIAACLMEDIRGADTCIDIHASNVFLREIPQVRISEDTAEALLPSAKYLNMNLVWIYAAATVLESTLAYSLNMADTPTLVVEMGVGLRITRAYGEQLIKGIFSLMVHMGMWDGPVSPVAPPIVSSDGRVSFVNASCPGIFLPTARHAEQIEAGGELGKIVDPLTGTVRETLRSPATGLLFTLREYPVVYEGSLLARILGGA
ncbi:MAG: M14 family metallopeptidase [Oscillospiraceae bacterium]|nr:M14 family metallopeptidase [Oscillospiraceae bacterium]MCC8080290.1 M14 family metallopeptidase [Oscillospiraceae bacterium]MCD8067192.1 M14 family metallopeptidase [Oscillospiraceae bacterium]MCD8100378.1 M14 family metallopeptidase [Oscillospiraceae bacterium]